MKKYIFGAVVLQVLIISVIYFTAKIASVDAVTDNNIASLSQKIVDVKSTDSLDSTTNIKSEKKLNNRQHISIDSHKGLASSEESDHIAIKEITPDNSKQATKATEAEELAQSDSSNKSKTKNNKTNISSGKVVTIVNNDGTTQEVKLLEVEVTDKLKQDLLDKAKKIEQKNSKLNSGLNTNIQLDAISASGTLKIANDLGMGNVPVLNQGQHGTCVTFATTALLNAKMNAGDFISQQCMLELGVHIGITQRCYDNCSGWEGLWNEVALTRIKQYGIISKETCPHKYGNTSYSLTYQSYLDLSSKLWADSFNHKSLKDGDLQAVKNAINNNNRVAIGMLLHKKFVAGVAVNGKNNGLWTIPYDINKFINELNTDEIAGGHALVITGYDDAKQLFKVRNSWGVNAGDSGEFYISYDYYELMAMEAIEVY